MPNRGFLIPLFLPTFFLLAAMGIPGLDAWYHHREVFGSPNYYLTLFYGGSPDGILAGDLPSRFRGSLVTPEGEVRVQGTREKKGGEWVYRISGTGGDFTGRLSSRMQICPRFLTLTPNSRSSAYPTELLQSSLCL